MAAPRRSGLAAAGVLLLLVVARTAAQSAPGCHDDSDCLAAGGEDWRCGQAPRGSASGLSCHIPGPGTKGNSTCVCSNPTCAPAKYPIANQTWTQYLMIGDSISIGMRPVVAQQLAAHNIELTHNPGNAANANWGLRNIDCWLPHGLVFDVISFQFGLHGIAYDTELLNDADYANLLGKILDRLGQEQRAHGTKLIWVNTTPVPTVPTYGPNCTNTSACLNPPRFDADVRRRNAIASKVVDAHTDLHVSTVDLYNVVLQKCGGEGYHTCDPWQLRDNVHYTQQGWELIGGVMANAVLRVAGAEQ